MPGLPNSLKRKRTTPKFNFSWMGEMATKIRRVLSQETEVETKQIERQSDVALQENSIPFVHNEKCMEDSGSDVPIDSGVPNEADEDQRTSTSEQISTIYHNTYFDISPTTKENLGSAEITSSANETQEFQENFNLSEDQDSRTDLETLPEDPKDSCEAGKNYEDNKLTTPPDESVSINHYIYPESQSEEQHGSQTSAVREPSVPQSALSEAQFPVVSRSTHEYIDPEDSLDREPIVAELAAVESEQEPLALELKNEPPLNPATSPCQSDGPLDKLDQSFQDSKDQAEVPSSKQVALTNSENMKKSEFPSVGFLFGPDEQPQRDSESQCEPLPVDNKPETGAINYEEKLEDSQHSDSVEQEEVCKPDEPIQASPWKRLSVGFTVAPATSLSETLSFDNSQSRETTYDAADEEFGILAQSAHRLMSTSSLFGGTLLSPKPTQTTQEWPVAREDTDLEYKSTSGRAHSLFASSSIFGGLRTKPNDASLDHKDGQLSNTISGDILDHSQEKLVESPKQSISLEPETGSISHSIPENEISKNKTDESILKNPSESQNCENNTSSTEVDGIIDASAPIDSSTFDSSKSKKKRSIPARKPPITRSALRALEAEKAKVESDKVNAEPSTRKRRLRKRQ